LSRLDNIHTGLPTNEQTLMTDVNHGPRSLHVFMSSNKSLNATEDQIYLEILIFQLFFLSPLSSFVGKSVVRKDDFFLTLQKACSMI